MKNLKLKTLTIIFGVVVALSAIAIGSSYMNSYRVAEVNGETEIMPSVNFIDLNKIVYIFSHK